MSRGSWQKSCLPHFSNLTAGWDEILFNWWVCSFYHDLQIQHKSDLTCWNFFANNKYLIRLVFANLLGWVCWTILCFFEGHDTYKYTYYTQIWIQSYTFCTWFITSISLIVTVLEFSVDIREGMYYINRQTHKTKEADSQHFCQFVFFRFWNIIGPAAIKLSSW